MVSGWRYRGLSLVGVVVGTAMAVTVANLPVMQRLIAIRIPILNNLGPSHLTNGRLVLVYATTLVIVGGAMIPLYKPRPRRILNVVLLVQRRVLIALLGLATIGYFDYTYRLPRPTLLGTGVVLMGILPIWFVWIRKIPSGDGTAIIIGDDPAAMADIYASVDQPIRGFVSSSLGDQGPFTDGGISAFEENSDGDVTDHLPRLGGLSRLDEVLVEYDVDTAYLAFESSDRAEFFGALDSCDEHGVEALVHRDHVDSVMTSASTPDPIVPVDLEPLDPQDYVFKRLFDVIFAGLGLVVLSPVIALIAVAIKVDSPGPILYEQERTAEFGDTFTIYKFRSMIPDAESETGVKLSDEDAGDVDPRVTRVGHILRKTHLDEIPQLWSILIGEMSVVGPRPERPEWDPEMMETAVEWRKRWFVKPGLTGLAQINDITGFEPKAKLQYDIEYIRQQSFWFDVKIVLRQIWMVLSDVVAFAFRGESADDDQR